jgi:hypothetical protein
LAESSAAGENIASLVEVSTSSITEGTDATADPAAGAAGLEELLLVPPGINPPNAAHPAEMHKENTISGNFRNPGTIDTSEVMQELEVIAPPPIF